MSEGSFNIRKWNSNSSELVERIREAEGNKENIGTDSKIREEDQLYV